MAPINLKMKFVLIGDGAVGKSSLLHTYINKGFPKEYIPTVMEQFRVEVPFGEQTIVLEVWDTAGQENFSELRNLSYPGADLFLICYSCVARASFNNISPVWMKEVEKYEDVKFVIVGTKSDLIEQWKEKEGAHSVIDQKEATLLVEKLGAVAAFQSSALLNSGVQECFKRAVKAVYDKRVQEQETACCTLL